MSKECKCHCHCPAHNNDKLLCLCKTEINHCEHCTQQKDAGLEEIENILLNVHYAGNLKDRGAIIIPARNEILALITQARQQAFTEVLEVAPKNELPTGDSFQNGMYSGFNNAIDEYRANIEKLKNE